MTSAKIALAHSRVLYLNRGMGFLVGGSDCPAGLRSRPIHSRLGALAEAEGEARQAEAEQGERAGLGYGRRVGVETGAGVVGVCAGVAAVVPEGVHVEVGAVGAGVEGDAVVDGGDVGGHG